MRASKKVQLWLIGSRQCAFNRAVDKPCTLTVSPRKGGVAFHFFMAGYRKHFKFRMWVEHSKSQPTDDNPLVKWAWSRHVNHFEFLVP